MTKTRRWAQGCVGKAWPVNVWARVYVVGLNREDLEMMMDDGGRWSEKKGHPPVSGPKEHKIEEREDQDFPGSWVIKILCFLCRGHRSDPWSRNQDPTCCVMWQKRKRSSTWFFWKGTSDSKEQSNLIKVKRVRDQDSGKSAVQIPVSSLLCSSSYNDWFFFPHVYLQQKSTGEDRTTKAKCKES